MNSFTFIFLVSAFLADVAMWNTHGSTADLFVQKPAVDGGAAAILESANVTYSVVIKDMQEAIDAENPRPEEIALLQDRKGEYKAPHRLNVRNWLEPGMVHFG